MPSWPSLISPEKLSPITLVVEEDNSSGMCVCLCLCVRLCVFGQLLLNEMTSDLDV